jgi:1,4-dihydroxy-6-naphthoate synthase
MRLTLAHSPDADDAFMFYALAKGLVDSGPFEFEHILQDIQTLNERALRGELDVTAVSIHAYPYLADRYALLSSGASMGDNYGPIVIGRRGFSREELLGVKIAVPGELTSAFLALQLYLGGKGGEAFDYAVVPFDEIFTYVRDGKADAGLIIHEGQLTYGGEGFALSVDLGKWWHGETGGLPLPLGGNAIRRDLGPDVIRQASAILRESIRFGLEHRTEGLAHARALGRGLEGEALGKFVGMYVNELTLDYGERGRRAVAEFLARGAKAGLVPTVRHLEFV